MEKIREEFEAWHIEQCKAAGMDWKDLSSELDRDGDGYVYTDAQYAWRGWKASRATLCVELPCSLGYPNNDMVYLSDVEERLEKAGVSYKW